MLAERLCRLTNVLDVRRRQAMTQLPPTYRRFAELNPAVSTASESLGEACAQAGSLDSKTRELITLALAVGRDCVRDPTRGDAGGAHARLSERRRRVHLDRGRAGRGVAGKR